MQHVGSRCDGVGTQEKTQSGFLGSGNKSVGCSLVAGDVHIAAWHLLLCLYAIDIDGRRVSVVSVIVTSLYHFDIVFGNGRFLGEFLT